MPRGSCSCGSSIVNKHNTTLNYAPEGSHRVSATEDGRKALVNLCKGDMRRVLNVMQVSDVRKMSAFASPTYFTFAFV